MATKTYLTTFAAFGLMSAFTQSAIAEDTQHRLLPTIDPAAAQCRLQQPVLNKFLADNYQFIFDFNRVNPQTRQIESYNLLAQPQTRNWAIVEMKGRSACVRHSGTNLSYTVVEPDSIIPVKGARSYDPQSPCDVFLLKSTTEMTKLSGNLLYTAKKEDGANLQIFRDALSNWIVAISSETPDGKCQVENLVIGQQYQQHSDEMEKVFGYFAINPDKFPVTPS